MTTVSGEDSGRVLCSGIEYGSPAYLLWRCWCGWRSGHYATDHPKGMVNASAEGRRHRESAHPEASHQGINTMPGSEK